MPPAAPRGTRLAPLLQYRNRAVTGEDWAGGGAVVQPIFHTPVKAARAALNKSLRQKPYPNRPLKEDEIRVSF